MLRDSGWFDWATQDPGPTDRILSSFQLPLEVIVHHSMEGVYNYPGGFIVLRAPQYKPTGWHWTVPTEGERFYQHYSVFAHLQHGHAANVLGPGGESEGFYHTPLTASQVAIWRRIHADVNDYRQRHGLPPLTRDPERRPQGTKRGLVEHREMAPQWNTTQCPSERYAPLWEQEDDLDQAEFDALAENWMARRFPNWLALAFEERPDKFSDRPDIPMKFPYRPAGLGNHAHKTSVQTITSGEVIT